MHALTFFFRYMEMYISPAYTLILNLQEALAIKIKLPKFEEANEIHGTRSEPWLREKLRLIAEKGADWKVIRSQL